MKSSSWRKFLRGATIRRDLDEIRGLVIRYVKEETVQPLKEMGRFIAYGVLGSVFVGFGAMMLLLAALRFLQEQFRVLDGSLSWLPYLIVSVIGVGVMGLTLWRIVSGTAKRRLRTPK